MKRAATLLAALLLILPAWDCIPGLRASATLAGRLRDRHRPPADTTWDRYYAQLIPYLPSDRVGLVQTVAMGTLAEQREYFFLQYALAPRLVVPGASEEFVVSYGSRLVAPSLLDRTKFTLVRAFEDDFSLYRRVRP